MLKDDPNLRVRLIQGGVLVGIAGLLLIVVVAISTRDRGETLLAESETRETSISRIDGVEAEEIWLQTAEGRIQTLEKAVEDSVAQNRSLAVRNDTLLQQKETILRDFRQSIDRYEDVISSIDETIINAAQRAQLDYIPPPPVDGDPSGLGSDPFQSGGLPSDLFQPGGVPSVDQPVQFAPPLLVPSLVNFTLNAKSKAVDFLSRDTEFWLPTGSHATAVITAGAAAPVGVRSQENPPPVIMRITGKAISAADEFGNTKKTDIRGCTITGEARGNLSAERVYVRLQTMTCQNSEGDGVVETKVQGFIAGTGQAGIRGPVISREGDLVRRSFAAGVIGGFGSAATSALNPPIVLDGSDANRPSESVLLGQAAQSGLASGIGTAGDKLADYYIERAEQYSPIISLSAGTKVEVVFLAGAWIDGRVQGN